MAEVKRDGVWTGSVERDRLEGRADRRLLATLDWRRTAGSAASTCSGRAEARAVDTANAGTWKVAGKQRIRARMVVAIVGGGWRVECQAKTA